MWFAKQALLPVSYSFKDKASIVFESFKSVRKCEGQITPENGVRD